MDTNKKCLSAVPAPGQGNCGLSAGGLRVVAKTGPQVKLESQAQRSFGLIWNEVMGFLLLHYTRKPLPPFTAL